MADELDPKKNEKRKKWARSKTNVKGRADEEFEDIDEDEADDDDDDDDETDNLPS